MKSRTLLVIVVFLVVLLLLVGAFSIGMFVGGVFAEEGTPVTEVLPEILPQLTPDDTGANTSIDRDELFKPFWQAWEIVQKQYVDQPVDEVQLMRGAIQGMLSSLGDQHTSYMDPDQYRQANIPLKGEYEGIGAWVDVTTEYLTVVSPMPDSPAEKAGLKAGDQVIAIDGEDMTGIDANLALRRVIGPAGTPVTLTILREDEPEPFDVTVTREKIVVPSVVSEMIDGNIGYIQLISFGDTTTEDLHNALDELRALKPIGLILDLRNNGGGGLQTAIEVASEFIGDGVIMYEEYGDGTRDTYNAIEGGIATEIPLVVLINEGSASASEIVAGAVQDTGRGKLVGFTSFGKGSVQNWIPLIDDQGAVRVTIARWLTPNGRTIHEIGLEPDIVVELTEEDVTAERDPQLDKAIELLTQP